MVVIPLGRLLKIVLLLVVLVSRNEHDIAPILNLLTVESNVLTVSCILKQNHVENLLVLVGV